MPRKLTARIFRGTPRNLSFLARCLRAGDIVGVPTETVYGLAADALNPRACQKIFTAKGRPTTDPLIVHIAALDELDAIAVTNAAALRLAQKFWPGPLTMVLPAREIVPDLVRSGLPTVALRCSAHPVMAAVIESLGRPVAAPSANRFGRISPVMAAHVVEELGARIPLVLDGGPCWHGLESTIVAVGGSELVLLRPGPVTREALQSVAPVVPGSLDSGISAPGMLASHYAPRTPLRLLAQGGEAPPDAAESGLLFFGPDGPAGFACTESLPCGAEDAAPLFFAALRRLDASGVRCIYAGALPESGLGLAIMDRLRRAAHG